MADKLRVGIIGANPTAGWAARAHMPGMTAGIPGVELVAVSTTRQESADEAAKAFGARYAFDDHRRMLELDDVDAVAVVVKLPHHYELTKDIISAGKHVYTEWPLATTTDEARDLAELASAKGLRTAVGLQARRSAEFLHIRRLIDEGYVGDVLSCTLTQFSGGGLGRPSARIWMRDAAVHANTLSIAFGHAIDGLTTAMGPIASLAAVVETEVREWTASDTGERFAVDAPDDVLVSGRLAQGGSVAGPRRLAGPPQLGVPFRSARERGLVDDTGGRLAAQRTGQGARSARGREGARGARSAPGVMGRRSWAERAADQHRQAVGELRGFRHERRARLRPGLLVRRGAPRARRRGPAGLGHRPDADNLVPVD